MSWVRIARARPGLSFQNFCGRRHSLPPPMSFNNEASSSKDPTEYLRSATFSKEGSPVSPENAVTASDLLLGSYDPAKLHPLADLGDKLDYLLLDDEKTSELPGSGTAIPSRGWSDDLCYGTGTMYLSGRSYRSLSNYCFCFHLYHQSASLNFGHFSHLICCF